MGGGMDMGQEQAMPAAQTTAPGPEMMPQGGGQDMGEDPFQILRARLPREIPDEVVTLIAYNKKHLLILETYKIKTMLKLVTTLCKKQHMASR